MDLQWVQFFIQLAILFVGCYIAFWKSYFTEKGKNLATVQDISQITELVESVKAEFAKETESLKSKLQLHLNVQGNLISE